MADDIHDVSNTLGRLESKVDTLIEATKNLDAQVKTIDRLTVKHDIKIDGFQGRIAPMENAIKELDGEIKELIAIRNKAFGMFLCLAAVAGLVSNFITKYLLKIMP